MSAPEVIDFAADRWVRVMADYSSDGLWDRDGGMALREELPVSGALKERHEAWCGAYEGSLDDRSFDMASFSAEGLLIAKAVKAELPDWTIVYFDEAACEAHRDGPRSAFEYEVTA